MTVSGRSRLPWIDQLRTAIILLVVHIHACVTYSHVGDWYVLSAREPSMGEKIPFILWQAHLQAFFMGLLFFFAGYFAEGSLGRRGRGAFMRERLLRLGVPALIYIFLIHPFILLVLNPWNADFPPAPEFFRGYLLSGRFLSGTGPLWFAVALLVFSWVFAMCRELFFGRSSADADAKRGRSASARAPSGSQLAALGVSLGLLTFLTRLVQPIGTSLFNMQLCFFPQYVVFFAVGILAARQGWLSALAASSQARRAGWLGLLGGPLVLGTLFALGGKQGLDPFMGGWHWQALGVALWEQTTGVALSVGALALFSRVANEDRPAWRWLSERTFGVYVLHAPVLVALMMAFRPLGLESLYGQVALLTVTGVALSFALATVVRWIPGARQILA